LIDVFIGTLKDNIQHEVRLWEPKSLENAFRWQEMLKVKIWLWLLEGPLLTSIERIMLLLLKHSTYKVDTSTIGGNKSKRLML
jgi:hypothetical protein